MAGSASPDRARQPFEVVTTRDGGRVRMVLLGELDLAQEDRLTVAFDEARDGASELVVDLRELGYIGSIGVRLMLLEAERARREGREFGVVLGSGEPRRLFDLLRIDPSMIRRVPADGT
jgi:anti-anti-sigma factor